MADGSSHHFTDARIAGLSPIPVDTSTKRPLVRWAAFQQVVATELDCAEWDQRGHNIAVVCGEVSNRLICLDFEGGFFDRVIYLDTAAHELLTLWARGYSERTPHGGQHILVRLEGEGPLEGNRKLAMGRDGKVLVETRGEGGYVIVAPSRNGSTGWELRRGGFDSIEWATQAEWATVVAALTELDESPPPSPSVPTSTATPAILRLSSWLEDELSLLPPVEEALLEQGWTQARSRDSYGQHWVRPDKDPREGHSASVSEAGRLFVHSSNAGLPVSPPSYDFLDVHMFGYLGRVPTLTERSDWLRDHRNQRMAIPPPAERAGPAIPSVRLDTDFWQSTEMLRAVWSASRGRMLAPTAVLGAFLSAYATTVPMAIWFPPLIGRAAPLNIYSCLVGRSGSGKTAAMGLAEELLGWESSRNPRVLLGQALRSGEGLPRLVVIPAKRGSDDAPDYNDAVQVEFDEGATLARQAERAGTTTIQYLNTAWSGRSTVGGAKASEIVSFPAGLVRICAVLGVQFGAAANLFTGANAMQGFPQRLGYFDLADPTQADVDVSTVGGVDVRPILVMLHSHNAYRGRRVYIDVPEHIGREIKEWSRNMLHGSGLTDPLDAHTMNLQGRIASIFALMEDRFAINDQDWRLSSQICDQSRHVRHQLVESMRWAELEKKEARKMEHLELNDALNLQKLEKIARRIQRYLESHDGCNWTAVRRNCFVDSERGLREEVIAYGEHRGWFTQRDGAYWRS